MNERRATKEQVLEASEAANVCLAAPTATPTRQPAASGDIDSACVSPETAPVNSLDENLTPHETAAADEIKRASAGSTTTALTRTLPRSRVYIVGRQST